VSDGWLRRQGSALLDAGAVGVKDEDERTVRRAFAAGSLCVAVLAPLWGGLYMLNGEVTAGLIPSLYCIVTFASFAALRRRGGWAWFRLSQTALMFALPLALMLTLGGYVLGSAVVIWAIIAPLGALWGGMSREAFFWVGAFLLAAVLSGLAQPFLRTTNNLPEWLRTAFFVLNVGIFMSVVVWLLDYFILQKQRVLDVMRRTRELESAYLQQEVSIRQSEKLATLGRLSAGLAHELNNPTAAVQRAAGQLAATWERDHVAGVLDRAGLEGGEREVVQEYVRRLMDSLDNPPLLDPLERSDEEGAVTTVLEGAGVQHPWKHAPRLVGQGMTAVDVERLRDHLPPDALADTVAALARVHEQASLLKSLEEGSRRIVELVGALHTYSNLDRAPRQSTDLHEGLESTLAMLHSRLRDGIEVTRRYSRDLPRVEAYPGDLNQVWTNILDNAIDAVDGNGRIEIVTRREDPEHVAVDIIDTGPGIRPDLLPNVFDPFVTTKPPGQGTGLGLNVAHGIVTGRHGGEITATSEPGRTTFSVRLPVDGAAPAAPAGDSGTRAQ
jgi:signal transduction histidine kinase